MKKTDIKEFINLTPHVVSLMNGNGEIIPIPPSGDVCRLETHSHHVGTLRLDGRTFPVFETLYGDIQGLPDSKNGTIYIVSALVVAKCDRKDVVAPDTGSTCLRHEDGRIKAVKGFVR